MNEAIRLREQGTDEARLRLIELTEKNPRDAVIAYQTAWAHDSAGLEAEAAPFYEQALAGEGLSTEDKHGVFVGLGSTYRVLGRYDESLTTLRRGLGEFPDDGVQRYRRAVEYYADHLDDVE